LWVNNNNGEDITGYDSWESYDITSRNYPYETPSTGFSLGTVQNACNKNLTLFGGIDEYGNP